MLNFKEAQKTILNAVQPFESELIFTKKSFGRVLANKVLLTRDFPDTRLSAIDGFAFCIGNEKEYRKTGTIGAGSLPSFFLEPGQCAAVMTGAPVPKGTDCMVKVEDCLETGGLVSTDEALKLGSLINEAGSEARQGTTLAQPGARLIQSAFATLFYSGIPEVEVYRLPKIGLLITGDELCDIDDQPSTGQVFDTNSYILKSFLSAIGLQITSELKVKDKETKIQGALESLADSCDIVVSSGGVSMGKYDYIKKTFVEREYNLLIQGTAIKPGKPLMVAEKGGTLFFGMPGYPAAFLVNCLLYLIPAIKKASGRIDHHHRLISATLATPLKSMKGQLVCNRVKLELGDEGWVAHGAGSQTTSHFLNFCDVNGLAILAEVVGNVEPGGIVNCLHFDLELC